MTIGFSLVMIVMTAFICASIVSVKVSSGRMLAANAVDQSLFSLFARYDRLLEEKYDLFYIDAGNNGSGPDIASVIHEIQDAAEYVMQPDKGRLIGGGKPILSLKVEQCGLTGYTLATDAGGASFASQAVQSVEQTAALQGISFLKEKLSGSSKTGEYGDELIRKAGNSSYAAIEEKSKKAREEERERQNAAEEAGEVYVPEEPQVPEGFRNPLPILEKLKGISILKLVVPDSKEVSKKKANTHTFVSGRALSQGMGVIDTTNGTMRGTDGLAFKAYILGHYSSFIHPSENSQLEYQMEYILYGKNSDEKNLKAAVKRIIALREAVNIACLYTDPEMSPRLSETAMFISTLLLIPDAEPLVKLILAAGWAYVESIVDVRAVLEGKRTACIKTAGSWQTDLDSLVESRGDISGLTKDIPGGLDYEDCLGALLLAASGGKLVSRAMDMTESEIRGCGKASFRLDACIGAVTAEVMVNSENRVTFPVEETMDYRDL